MATARKNKAEETPGYCKTEDLANLFGLTGQWINQLTRDGVIKRRDTPAGKRYNVVESVRAYTQYLRDKAANRADRGIPEDKELEKFDAEVRIKRAKAEIAELEARYEAALSPVFGSGLRVLHKGEDLAHVILDGEEEAFYFTLYGTDHVRLYWCGECFIFCRYREELVSSDTFGEIVFEGAVDEHTLPALVVELILQLKDGTFAGKEERIQGKTFSGWDDRRDYVLRVRTNRPAKSPYRLANILLAYQ